MNDITQPLRLAVGNHVAGSGKGCAMNVLSWENGDKVITDMPNCTDPFLAKLMHHVNDNACKHRSLVATSMLGVMFFQLADDMITTNSSRLLCAECSVKVLDLAHRTVGSAGWGHPVAWSAVSEELQHPGTAWIGDYVLIELNSLLPGPPLSTWATEAPARLAAHRAVHAVMGAKPSSTDIVTYGHDVVDLFCKITGFEPTEPEPERVTNAVAEMARVS